MAEDDGVSFGDFTFAFPANPSFHFHQQTSLFNGPNSKINTVTVAKPMEEQESDDEWGDFVKSPLGSVASANALSKPFDPFNFYSPNSASPSQSPSESGSTAGTVSGPSGDAAVKGATQWVKLKGAIPLSIFGDVEEEEKKEEVERSGGVDPHDRSEKENDNASAVNSGSKNNAHLGVGTSSDVIASLYRYNHQMNFETGMGSNINRSYLDTNEVDSTKKEPVLELNGVNLDINSIPEKRDLDAVTDLKDQGHKVHLENGFIASTNGKNSNMDVLNAHFTDGVISSSNFSRTNGEFGISGGNQSENDVWESKDAYSEPKVSNGNEKAQSEMHKVSEANTYSRQPKIGSDGSIDLFAMSNSSFNLFSMSNGISSSSSDVAAGLNARSDAATQIGFASEPKLIHEQTKAKSGLGREITVASVESDDDFGEFATAFAEAGPMQEMHRISDSNTRLREPKIDVNGSIDLFAMSNGSFDLFSTSSGISSDSHDIAVGWDDKPNAAAQNGFRSGSNLLCEQKNAKSGLGSDIAVASAESDDDFGEFASAFAEAGTVQEQEDLKDSDISSLEREKTFSDGKLQAESRVQSAHMNVPSSKIVSSSNRAIDLFSMSNGPIALFAQVNGMPTDSDQVDRRFNLNPSAVPRNEVAHNDYSFQTSSRSEQADCQDGVGALQFPADDEEFGEFNAAFEEEAQKLKGAETSTNDQKGPLPLSIFGEEEVEIDDSLNIRGALPHLPGSSKKNASSPKSTMSINDLISNLYCQAEQISAVESTEKLAQNGSTSSGSVIDSHKANDSGDFDNSSWEFKDGFSEKGTSLLINGDSHQSCSTKLKLNNYVDFYSKLKDELCLLVTRHLENLKEAQSAGIFDEDANLATLLEEIQEACMESGQMNSIAQEDISRHHLQRDADFSEFFQALQEPKFHVLDSEYSIQRKLPLAQSDFRSAIELIMHVRTMLKILSLGSLEEQLTYVSLWSKMIYTCAQELRHGAELWRDSLEKNVQSQILADPQGKRFVLAIGEIYRVAVVLGASAKLYKPWTLSSFVESSSIPTLVDECHALWQSSGLEEALLSIPGPKTSEGDYCLTLLDSIRYTRDLDTVALQSNVFDQQEPVCQLSLLTSRVAPGMAMVVWGDMQCFVKLANLWANLISTDCPKLPSLHVS